MFKQNKTATAKPDPVQGVEVNGCICAKNKGNSLIFQFPQSTLGERQKIAIKIHYKFIDK